MDLCVIFALTIFELGRGQSDGLLSDYRSVDYLVAVSRFFFRFHVKARKFSGAKSACLRLRVRATRWESRA